MQQVSSDKQFVWPHCAQNGCMM